MSLRKVGAMLLNKEGKVLTTKETADTVGVSSNYASALLCTLVKMGLAKKIRRGEYVFSEHEILKKYLEGKQKKQKGDDIGDAQTSAIFIRPHRLFFTANSFSF